MNRTFYPTKYIIALVSKCKKNAPPPFKGRVYAASGVSKYKKGESPLGRYSEKAAVSIFSRSVLVTRVVMMPSLATDMLPVSSLTTMQMASVA